VVTKTGSLSTLSLSLHRSQRPASFSPQSNGSLRPHKDHHNLVSLALTTKVLRTRNGEEEERSKNKSSKNTSKNYLSSHYLLGVEMGLGEALILFDLCLVLIALALVLNVKSENLDALKCGGWGVFIAPTTKMVVGSGCCQWAHRTVWWCTGQSLFTVRCAFWRCSDFARSVRTLCTC
jgi:hypothetical protein